MNNEETIQTLLEESQVLTEETTKTRKRKLLTNPDNCWAKCKVCKETGNLENLIRHQIPVFKEDKKFYNSFNYVYFCSVACQELFNN